MTCRPHHALCPARDGGECCCEPLTAEERAFLRAQAGLSVRRQMPMPYYLSADVLRLLHERDCLERETITTRVPCARCGQGVRPREMADGRCADCLRVERDEAIALLRAARDEVEMVDGDPVIGCPSRLVRLLNAVKETER